MLGKRPLELWIKDCRIKECEKDGRRYHYHALNPKGQAVKVSEMTVLRAIKLIEAFDAAPNDDPTYIEPKTWRGIYGDGWYTQPEVNHVVELARRYQDRTLHRQVIDLYNNLPPEVQKRKEIKVGIRRIRKAINS